MPSAPYAVREPLAPAVPVVVDSPHSGMEWPPDFQPSAPRADIQTTWDAYVDELWGDAPAAGATLIAATFPRAYIDVNRAENDIDPTLLDGEWPGALAPTPYSERGMGLIRRLALPGVPMYGRPLAIAAVERRIAEYHRPYRAAVRDRLVAARAAFGCAWYLDCHSMKSRGNEMNVDAGEPRPDFVVSDRHGRSANGAYTTWIADWFRRRGFSVSMNEPYQGGDLVAHFGDPVAETHAIQIEINRALYLDEPTMTKSGRFEAVRRECADFLRAFVDHVMSSRR